MAKDQESILEDILTLSGKYQVLTISDMDSFTLRGGMFGFVRKKNKKVVVELNYNNVKSARINISAALLRMIKVIESPNNEPANALGN